MPAQARVEPRLPRASGSFKTEPRRAIETAGMSENAFTPALGRFAPTRFYDHAVALTRDLREDDIGPAGTRPSTVNGITLADSGARHQVGGAGVLTDLRRARTGKRWPAASVRQTARTWSACGPLGPCRVVYSTR